MTSNIINPKLRSTVLLNLAKAAVVLLASRSGIWRNLDAFNRPYIQSVIQRSSPYVRAASPYVRTSMVSAIIPLAAGYAVRRFEDRMEYTGRTGFHDEPRQDLMKMSHYAFHSCMMGAMSWGLWKLSKPLAEDIRVAGILSGIYFYAVGRAYFMDPAESFLMMRVKYMPAICLGIVAANRVPAIKKNIPLIGVLMNMGNVMHMWGLG